MSIFFCSFRRPSKSRSGVGGQPGTYRSHGRDRSHRRHGSDGCNWFDGSDGSHGCNPRYWCHGSNRFDGSDRRDWGHRRHLVLLLLGLSGGCGGERNLFSPVDGVTGTGGRNSGDARLIGEWATIILVDVPGDSQTWTTTWVFRDDLTCRFTRSILSIAEGVPRVTIRTCTWRTANATVLVTYTDPPGTASALPYDFVSFDPNRLLLEGIEYRRVSR